MSSILFIFEFYVQHRFCRFILYFLLCSFEGRNVNMLKVFLCRYCCIQLRHIRSIKYHITFWYSICHYKTENRFTFYMHRCRIVRNIFYHESRETSTTFQKCKLGFITPICHIMRYRHFRHFSDYRITAFNCAMR